jgi:hypothetical protein
LKVKGKNFDTNRHLFGKFLSANDPKNRKLSIKTLLLKYLMLRIKTMKEASLIRGHGLVTDQFPQKGNRGRHMKVAIQD